MRISLLVLFVFGLFATACVSKREEPLGGKWVIVWETSAIPESGGLHPYLHRKGAIGSKRVEENTWRYRYLGDDCVLYVAGNSNRRELMAACGDNPPVEIAPRLDDSMKGEIGDGGLKGDPVIINGVPHSIAAIKQRAGFRTEAAR